MVKGWGLKEGGAWPEELHGPADQVQRASISGLNYCT